MLFALSNCSSSSFTLFSRLSFAFFASPLVHWVPGIVDVKGVSALYVGIFGKNGTMVFETQRVYRPEMTSKKERRVTVSNQLFWSELQRQHKKTYIYMYGALQILTAMRGMVISPRYRHENELSCQNLKMMKKPEKVPEIVQKRPKRGWK